MNAVLPFADARHLVEHQARTLKPVGTETVSLLEARDRVLAESIVADRDFPPLPRATRDGYAVRAKDTTSIPSTLRVAGEIKAGAAPELADVRLDPGDCVAIMTGAPVPPDANAVVMVEHTAQQEDHVIIRRAVSPGENVVPRGAEARAGRELLPSGTRPGPAAIALAASVGQVQIVVYQRPSVAILATGDEIVGVDDTPGPNQIRNSNSYSLAAQVAAAGGKPVILPIAPDQAPALRDLISQGLRADLLLLSGGVSMGKYDLVEQVLTELGAEFFFAGALIQPGRPIVFGQINSQGRSQLTTRNAQLFFGLPGNPVSTMVTFDLFVRPILDALAGATAAPLRFTQTRLKSDFATKPGLTRFLPALLVGEFEHSEVEPVVWQGSGDIAATARANCYFVVPPDKEQFASGEMVSVLLTE